MTETAHGFDALLDRLDDLVRRHPQEAGHEAKLSHKSKHGRIDVLVDCCDELARIGQEIELQSERTCHVCGRPGESVARGESWVSVCEEHRTGVSKTKRTPEEDAEHLRQVLARVSARSTLSDEEAERIAVEAVREVRREERAERLEHILRYGADKAAEKGRQSGEAVDLVHEIRREGVVSFDNVEDAIEYLYNEGVFGRLEQDKESGDWFAFCDWSTQHQIPVEDPPWPPTSEEETT